MRTGFLLLTVLLFTAVGAAEPFTTVFFTDQHSQDLEMEGNTFTDATNRTLTVVAQYNLTLVNDAYNKTTINDFVMFMENRTSIAARKRVKSMEGTKLEHGTSVSGFVDMTGQVSPLTIETVGFLINHTALHTGGGTIERSVQGPIPFTVSAPDARITSFDTNMTNIYRDQRVYVSGNTENINRLYIDGTAVPVAATGDFNSWIHLPANLTIGPQSITYNLTSSWGHRFTRSIYLTVLNRPPSITLDYRKEVELKQKTLTVTATTSDDAAVVDTRITFNNTVYHGNTATFPTGNLTVGNYTFAVEAVDDNGATTVEQKNFTVTYPTPEPDPGTNGNNDDTTNQDDDQEQPPGKLPEEDPVQFATDFLSFFTEFLNFLIP